MKYSSYESLKSFSFAQVFSEILTNFPFVLHLFCAMSLSENDIKTKSLKRVQELIPRWCVLYSILLQSKDARLNVVQHLSTCLLLDCHCEQKVIMVFQLNSNVLQNFYI